MTSRANGTAASRGHVPDKKLYPDYDDWLETSMRNEPVEYFREMLTKNLPIEA